MDYSKITETLFIGTTPSSEDYPILRDLGVRLVINMRLEHPPYRDHHVPPIQTMWLPTIDSPLFPMPVSILRRGAVAALKMIEEGGKVYTHCASGVHRGAAMGAAILIAQGHTPQEAIQLIVQRRMKADPKIWYIYRQIVRFADKWDHHQ